MDTLKATKMQPATDAVIEELRNRLEAAEKERDALRAKIAEMEQQEPVAWRYQDVRGNHRYRSYVAGFDVEYRALKPIPLYTLPGAKGEGK